jgi:hypothetical protein
MNEVTVKETNALSTEVMDMAWGADEVEATDIRIPRILLQQSQSELVAERKAQSGDIIETSMNMKLGDDKTPIKIVPIHIFKDWKIEKMVNGKYEYYTREDYTVANSNRPREEVINGEQIRNVLGINVLCMLDKDLEDPSALPHIVTFRMTGMNAGKDIATLGVRAKSVNKPVANYTIELGCDFTKNDKGNFFQYRVKGVSQTRNFAEVAPRLFGWYQTFKSGAAKVDAEEAAMDNDPIVVGGTSDVGSKF